MPLLLLGLLGGAGATYVVSDTVHNAAKWSVAAVAIYLIYKKIG